MLSLAILCAAGMVYYHLWLFAPRAMEVRAAQGYGNGYSFGADFYPIWLTSRQGVFHHRDPYSAEMTRQIQTGLFGRPLDAHNSAAPPDYRTFAYPAFVDLLFWPLGLLSFSVVRIAVAIVLAVATAVSVVLWLRSFHLRAGVAVLVSVMVLTLSSYAVLEGLFADQVGLLVGFLVAAALAALVQRKLFLAGSLLGLALVKPQMMALAGAYLLLWSLHQGRLRWRLLSGFALISSVLVGSSLLVWPRWIHEWLQVLFGYRQYATPPLVCYLLGSRVGSRLGPLLIAALLASAAALAWRMRRASPTSIEFALTISLLAAITAVTLLPGHAVYDHIVLLPGILLVAFSWRGFAASSRVFRVVLGVTALALFWQWILAPVVIAAQPILPHRVFVSAVLTLPIRTAASIPFGVLALLGLMLREVARKRIAGSGNL
ncbi:MAG: glycosyltransferase family 87 protein [Candidatus Sulfotelmatobacter sp.]